MKRRIGVGSVAFIYLLFWLYQVSRYFPWYETTLQLNGEDETMKANYTNLHFTHHASKLISRFPCSIGPLKLLILVSSDVKNEKQRALIRRTWGRKSAVRPHSDYKLLFVCGVLHTEFSMQAVFHEGMIHRDIIFGNFSDSDENSAYKADAVLEYAFKHCVYEYLLKVDEDVFINLSRLITLIHQVNIPQHNLYLGRVFQRRKIVQKIEHKNDKSPDELYWSFCNSKAVVFSSDLVQRMVPYFRSTPHQNADLYIGVLAMKAGARAINSDKFHFKKTKKCVYDDEAVASQSSFYRTDNCIEKMFFTMLVRNYKDPFVSMHYISKRLKTEIAFTRPT